MAFTLVRSILIALAVYSGSVAASIIPYSQNPSLLPGSVAYSAAAGWPTPLNAPATNPPAARDYFSAGESVRVAEMLDLQALNAATDEVYGSASTLQWLVFWYDDPLATAYSYFNNIEINWSDIATLQSGGQSALAFWTDAYMPAAGNWIADTYFEGSYSSSAQFNVPEPSTLFLLGLGLVGVMVRKRV